MARNETKEQKITDVSKARCIRARIHRFLICGSDQLIDVATHSGTELGDRCDSNQHNLEVVSVDYLCVCVR